MVTMSTRYRNCVLPLLVALFALTGWQPTSQAAKDVKPFNIIEKLHNDLLKNYNKQIRPVVNHTEALKVNVSLTLTQFDYDDIHLRLSVRGFFRMVWTDPRFTWSPSDYEGLSTVHLPNDMVWTPDLEVYDTDGPLSKDRDFARSVQVLITNTGLVFYVPHSNFLTSCYTSMKNWPYDAHDCRFKLGSWTHHIGEMKLVLDTNGTTVDLMDLKNSSNSRWNLLNATSALEAKKYSCCPELYESLNFTISFQRRSPAAKYTIIVPTFAIAILTLVTLWMPPMLSSKVVVGTIDLALVIAYLIYFDSAIPLTGAEAPLIVTFYGNTSILVIVSIVLSAITLSWTRPPKSCPAPSLVQKLLSSPVGRLLTGCSSKAISNPSIEEQDLATTKEALNDTSNGRGNIQNHWILLSLAIHRLLLVIYCVVFAIFIKCYIC